MTKMNRREYLVGMGATVGAIATGGKTELLAQRRPRNQGRTAGCPRPLKPRGSRGTDRAVSTSEKPWTWRHQWADPFPTMNPNEVVKLIFYGQNGFSPRGQGLACDVGFHSSGDSAHNHRLSIQAFDRADSANNCRIVYPQNPGGPHIDVERLALIVDPNDVSVKDARFNDGVYFFQPNQAVTSRRDLRDPKDFRWIIDFESDYLYRKFLPGNPTDPKVLPKNANIYRPIFSVPYGLFYTLHKTGSTFRAQTKKGEQVSDLGSVADLIGANVYLKPNASVTLMVNSIRHVVRAPGEIYFSNLCYRNRDYVLGCETEPHNLDEKEKRSDFFLNYKAFRRGGAREYELFLAENQEPEDVQGLVCLNSLMPSLRSHGIHHGPLFRQSKSMFITDEAPCAGAGYGGGGGLT